MLIILYFLKVLLFLNLGEERRANLTFTNRTWSSVSITAVLVDLFSKTRAEPGFVSLGQ